MQRSHRLLIPIFPGRIPELERQLVAAQDVLASERSEVARLQAEAAQAAGQAAADHVGWVGLLEGLLHGAVPQNSCLCSNPTRL
jgi:hypothetical protein